MATEVQMDYTDADVKKERDAEHNQGILDAEPIEDSDEDFDELEIDDEECTCEEVPCIDVDCKCRRCHHK